MEVRSSFRIRLTGFCDTDTVVREIGMHLGNEYFWHMTRRAVFCGGRTCRARMLRRFLATHYINVTAQTNMVVRRIIRL